MTVSAEGVENQKLNNGSSAIVWLSFWFSTRFTRKKLGLSCRIYLYPIISPSVLSDELAASSWMHWQHQLGCTGCWWSTPGDMMGVLNSQPHTASAEGRVEHQKLNQTAPQGVVYTVFRARCHLQSRSTVDSASKQENFAHVFVHYLG